MEKLKCCSFLRLRRKKQAANTFCLYLTIDIGVNLKEKYRLFGQALANKLDKAGIEYLMGDNAFVDIADFEKAQQISDSFDVEILHRLLVDFADTFCPIIKSFGVKYHWSVMQVEYSTDIVFRRQKDLKEIYDHLIATAVHTVKPDKIATFLGRKMHGRFKGEMGNRYDIRKEGIRVKHTKELRIIIVGIRGSIFLMRTI